MERERIEDERRKGAAAAEERRKESEQRRDAVTKLEDEVAALKDEVAASREMKVELEKLTDDERVASNLLEERTAGERGLQSFKRLKKYEIVLAVHSNPSFFG